MNPNEFQLANGKLVKLLAFEEEHLKKVEQLDMNIDCYTVLKILSLGYVLIIQSKLT
jgi:hypothetical protein